jgi:siroheme synthase-like protein
MCLVFAATDDRLANHRAAVAAKGHCILVNVADSQPECDFIVPARVSKGNVQVAVSTSGESPRLSAELRRRLEEIL